MVPFNFDACDHELAKPFSTQSCPDCPGPNKIGKMSQSPGSEIESESSRWTTGVEGEEDTAAEISDSCMPYWRKHGTSTLHSLFGGQVVGVVLAWPTLQISVLNKIGLVTVTIGSKHGNLFHLWQIDNSKCDKRARHSQTCHLCRKWATHAALLSLTASH